MHLLQYRVDFTPDVDHIGARKALIRVHEAILGKYLFDGTLLYNISRLPQVNLTFRKLKNCYNYFLHFHTAIGTVFQTPL